MTLGLVLYGGIAGLLAGLLMILSEIPFYRKFGFAGVVEWKLNEIIVSRLFNQLYIGGKRRGWAIFTHLSHGIVLGVLFSILMDPFLPAGFAFLLVAGLLYSLALWVVVPFSLRSAFERTGKTRFTRNGMIIALFGHTIYGLALGWVLIAVQ